MESDGVVDNGSSGDDDDGLLDEDIPGGDDDNLLDDAELDYTEDILEEPNEEHLNDDKPVSPQEPVNINVMSMTGVWCGGLCSLVLMYMVAYV